MKDYKLKQRNLRASHTLIYTRLADTEQTNICLFVYLQLNKKKAKAEGKKCHAKTMWSQ